MDGALLELRPGHALLIFPFQSHHFARFERPDRVSWLFSTFEFADSELLQPLRNTPFTYEDRDRERLLHLCQAYQGRRNSGDLLTQDPALELTKLLAGLLARQRRYVKQAAARSVQSPHPPENWVERLSKHIYRNLDRAITIEELARLVCLSPSRLRARFKEIVGIPIGDFIRRTRIHKASGLLHSTNQTVTAIAESCGFDSLFSFSRAFRNIVGESPLSFRIRARSR